MTRDKSTRCFGEKGNPMQDYHDLEWGVPVRDERHMFELVVLEGAQAGLSWEQVLKRRAAYRAAFHDFDIDKVAAMDERDVERLMQDKGIIRNRLKINAAITNARATLELQGSHGSLVELLWSFVGDKPVQNAWKSWEEVPAQTDAAVKMSKALKKLGFKFVGPLICYAHMQSAGLVNDHLTTCFRHEEVKALG